MDNSENHSKRPKFHTYLILAYLFCLFILTFGFYGNSSETGMNFPSNRDESLPDFHFYNGILIYENQKLISHMRDNVICITGTRMNQLWNGEMFQSLQNQVLSVSDADVFLYGFYSGDFNFSIFKNFGSHLAGAILIPFSKADQVESLEYLKFVPKGLQARSSMGVLQLHHLCYQVLLQRYSEVVRKKQYKVIMRARPDMFYLTPVNISLFSTKDYEPEFALYSPPPYDAWGRGVLQTETGACYWPWEEKFGITDQCIIGSPHSMDLFSHVLYTTFNDHLNETNFIEGELYRMLVQRLNVKSIKAHFHYDLRRY